MKRNPNDLTRFTARAYNAGKVEIPIAPWFAVYDANGITARSPQLPLIRDDPAKIIGYVDKFIVGYRGHVTVSGFMATGTAIADETVAMAATGFKWKVALIARIDRPEYIEAGRSVTVNEATFYGPLVVSRETSVSTISVIAVGPGDGTSIEFTPPRRKA